MKININKRLIRFLLGTSIVFTLSGCQKKSVSDDYLASIEQTAEDMEEFNCFSDVLLEIENFIQNDQILKAKEQAKQAFITGVDFVFYDQPIGNVYFDELTNESKEIVIDNLLIIDNTINSIVPNWRSELEDKYNNVSNTILDNIHDYLGDKNYEAVGEIKNQIKSDLLDIKNNTKEKVKSWYEKFRSSSK